MSPLPDTHNEPDIFAGGGEMGELMRRFEWSRTPIGSPETWSPALKTTVRILLANRFPLLLWWGPDYISLYNDAYRPVLGKKHPWGLGKSFRECWPEVAHVLTPLIDRPFFGGPATWSEDIELEIHRFGFPEETHFTIAYSPVPDDAAPGGIGGVLATVHEITDKVVGQRRVSVLRDLGARTGDARTVEEACVMAAAALGSHEKDVPFALLYVTDQEGNEARLAAVSGQNRAVEAAPETVRFDRSEECEPWPIAKVHASGKMENVNAPQRAAVLPIRSHIADRLAGFLVAGVNTRLVFDEAYRNFLELACSQIGTAIANARAYEAERRRAEALTEVDQAKTAFFANVSHEFRTPLTLMLGPLENLLAGDRVSGEERDQIDTAYRSSLRLLRLVNSLLDFSRIEAGRMKACYAPADLATMTKELASNFCSAMQSGGLEFAVDCASLPEHVFVDHDMWEKIVLNLLSNAFKFTLDGKVSVSLKAEGECAVLSVADTGVGITDSAMPHIFERFYRAEGGGGRTYEGTGIGLALVRELVRLHGGCIDVESRVGEGSRFIVSIPFGSAHLPQDQIGRAASGDPDGKQIHAFVTEVQTWLAADSEAEDSRAEPAHAGAGHRPSVLIADDNADMREHLRAILHDRYHVRAFSDGRVALEAMRRMMPHLVLSDIMMPHSDGFELLREIRKDAQLRDIPVLLLSARAGEEARTDGIAAGADDYITKPFSARELLARVRTAIELQQQRRRAREALEVMNDELRRANADLEQFAYSASHDLQEPLRGVKIFSELLQQRLRGKLDKQGEEFLNHLRNGADRMEALVKDLLSYTQVSHAEEPGACAPAGDALKSALGSLDSAIAESGASVECGGMPALPVHGHHLQLVFQNLISNAIKYRREGVPPKVTVSARRQDGYWLFGVGDNGIGIDPEYREPIFGLFKRLHHHDQYGGTGIGLAICKRIVERYYGRIWVESEVGKGSTFFFTLPA